MAIISASTIVRSVSVSQLVIAYYLLTSPSTISEQNLVFILGAAMDLPSARSFKTPSPATALLSAVLSLFSFSDLSAASLPQEVASFYWSSQAPMRLLFFFVMTFYSYVFKSGGVVLAGREFGKGGAKGKPGWDDLKNSLVFTWSFVEMLLWFWIYVTLRDERREAVISTAQKKKADEDRL